MINIYVIYDKAAETSSNPYYAVNISVATRAFCQTLADVPDYIKHDYDLYHIGIYYPDKMHIDPLALPDHVCNGSKFVKIKDQEEIK